MGPLWVPGSRTGACGGFPRQSRQLGIHYIVVEDLFLQLTHQTIEQWMDRYNAELIAQATFKSQPTYHSSQIYLVRLRSE